MSYTAKGIRQIFGSMWNFFAHLAEVTVLLAVLYIAFTNRQTIRRLDTLLVAQKDAIVEYRMTTPTRTEMNGEFTKLMMEVGRLNGSLDTLIKLQGTGH